ncbi:hypothetical protein [Halobacteriovorax sp. HLS]|uniref:hypothetical protein n=1 Tax=Halobacteriovorax sp. HLS TaxID=2234000 RepID=UPI000FDAD9BC|nr:hypothetical protein [Halobacteriovorax sp. HLS]
MLNGKHIIKLLMCLILSIHFVSADTDNVNIDPVVDDVMSSTPNTPDTDIDSSTNRTSNSDRNLSGLGLDDYEKVAKQIFLVKEAMSDDYAVGDGLTLTLYILRYLAEVGEYELKNEDIVQLVNAFEKITGEQLDEKVKDVVAGIARIEFGKKDDTYFAKIFTINKDGIIIPIHEKGDDGKIDEIRYAKIKNKAKIKFTDVVTSVQKSEIKRFLTEKISLPIISESWLPPLNQLHKDVDHEIGTYLRDTNIIPMRVTMKGIFIKVKTKTFLKNMDFYVRKVYTLAGREKNGQPIPSFIMRMRAGLVNVKISIDQ